jgi:MFS family permease
VVAYGTNVSTPLLVLYKERLGLSDVSTMAIFTVYVVGIIISLLLAGPASDRFGRRRIVLPFTAISAVASVVLIFGRDEFLLLLFGRLVLGAVSGAVFGVGAAWMQELHGPGNEQRSALLTTLATFGGFGAGPPITALVEQLGRNAFIEPFVLHFAVTVVVLALIWPVPETSPGSKDTRLRINLGVPATARHTFWRTVVPAAVWVFGFPSAAFALFPVLISEQVSGFEVAVAAASGIITSWAALLARPILPRIGARAALPIGLAIGTVGYILGAIAFGSDAWPLVLPAALALGSASGLLTAGALGILAEMADDESRGTLNSTFYLLAYPGMSMPIVITTLARAIGLSAALATVTVAAAVTMAVAAVRWRGHDRQPASSAM